MSYTKRYSETITVHGSKTTSVSYPASQSGGTRSVTVSYTEHVPVHVNIHVDTNPFDSSVDTCNNHVNALTTSVVATKAAHVASIDKNSKKIASTIIGGFFGLIRSEISQQIAELSQGIDAHLMHLRELSQSVLAKKEQMGVDYNRITGRYVKIFTDLNHELSNRVFELDKPTFLFKKETDNQKIRLSGNDLVSTVSVFGAESGELQSKISASVAKKRAFDTLNKAKQFLWQQKMLNHTIQQSMITENTAGSKYISVCYLETKNEDKRIDQALHVPEDLLPLKDRSKKNILMTLFSKSGGKSMTKEYNDNLALYFNAELNKSYPAADPHSARVKEMIRQIADFNAISIIRS